MKKEKQDVNAGISHFRLDHDNCLEIVAICGRPKEVEKLLTHLMDE